MHCFGNKIPNFWSTLSRIKSLNPEILYIGTQAPPNNGFVFQYDEEIQQDNSILDFIGDYDDYVTRIIPMLESKQWIKYLIIQLNGLYIYKNSGGEELWEEGTVGNRAIIDKLGVCRLTE